MTIKLDRPIKGQRLVRLVRRESIVMARLPQLAGPLEMHGQRLGIRSTRCLELPGQTHVQFAPPIVSHHVDHGFPDPIVVGLYLVERSQARSAHQMLRP